MEEVRCIICLDVEGPAGEGFVTHGSVYHATCYCCPSCAREHVEKGHYNCPLCRVQYDWYEEGDVLRYFTTPPKRDLIGQGTLRPGCVPVLPLPAADLEVTYLTPAPMEGALLQDGTRWPKERDTIYFLRDVPPAAPAVPQGFSAQLAANAAAVNARLEAQRLARERLSGRELDLFNRSGRRSVAPWLSAFGSPLFFT
jgi:hypothetical protein